MTSFGGFRCSSSILGGKLKEFQNDFSFGYKQNANTENISQGFRLHSPYSGNYSVHCVFSLIKLALDAYKPDFKLLLSHHMFPSCLQVLWSFTIHLYHDHRFRRLILYLSWCQT